MSDGLGTVRPLRRDAVRNHELVLCAARELIAESGIEASMEAIATRAGVGVGTVYRRFPSKDALVAELVGGVLDGLIAAARAALTRGDGTGLEYYLHDLGRSLLEVRRYAGPILDASNSAVSAVLRGLIAELHAQAIAHGRLDARITVADVMTTVWAVRGVIEATAAVDPRAWERHLAIHLAALRLTPAPSVPPSMTQRQLDELAATGKKTTATTSRSNGSSSGPE